MFALHYVRTGIFSPEDQALYSRLQTIRERADYQNVYNLPADEGRDYFAMSENLLHRMEDYLIENNRITTDGKDREEEA